MRVHVFDTHVTSEEGKYYHFDVIVDDDNTKFVSDYVKEYLSSINVQQQSVKQQSCAFCHTETANDQIKIDIANKGYHILPMQGCPQ
ncbi:DUF2024 family protein [Aestuariibacter sp. AA17]|uniref:DUF2024 family protein n=1 Tax=Fluctibacter corallii TaxID=2984329 RepID=A0ABT3A7F4_9ALTE|nr:DUF2024 family protein [Aestuariibacter sp. AA17]MCV2884609.1 DUF2024 family protein [Aestuariibacter sp. AA17]